MQMEGGSVFIVNFQGSCSVNLISLFKEFHGMRFSIQISSLNISTWTCNFYSADDIYTLIRF